MAKAQFIIGAQRFPSMWAICDCCNGAGQVENAAFSNGFTSEEWADMADDWDERDGSSGQARYMRGDYDTPCRDCSGSGKVAVPNVSACTFAQKRVLAAARREENEDAYWRAEFAAESAAERRMGC